MLEERDREYAGKLLSDIGDTVTLGFLSTDHPENKRFEKFVEEFASLSERIRVEVRESAGENLPAIVVGGKVYYHAIPDKTEFTPFMDAISLSVKDRPSVPAKNGADLKVVVMAGCIHCPNAVRNAVGFAFSNNGVRVSIIDGMMFKDAIEKFDIKSAPTTIINDQVFLTGVIPEKDLARWVYRTNEKHFLIDDFVKMIKEGNAHKLADMMIDDGVIYQDFLSLLWDDKWSLRLGTMVVLEDIYEKKQSLIKTVIKEIEKHLFDNDLRNRCDAAFLIGNIGGKDSIPVLESAMTMRQEDIFLECVEEAISLIRRTDLL
jgi:hypothetical protein